jgi:pyruvate formate lyase activating enzyme
VPASGTPPADGAGALNVGGLQRFTTIDYPGALAAVVFVQGCAWRCSYCHNPQLQPRRAAPGSGLAWAGVRDWLATRRGLLDAVVFSGGEPTLDLALPAALAETRALGFRNGLHTAGMAPRRLQALLPLLDWVGLDVKAPLRDGGARHDAITGVRGAAVAVRRSLALLLAAGVPLQLRTTVHPQWLSTDELESLQRELAALGAPDTVVQPGHPPRQAAAAAP